MSARSRLFLVLALLGAVSSAHAAQRTFVASQGLDANPCSLAAPCRSFGAAIAQTSVGGEVIVLDSAGYGPILIGSSISIVAPAGIYAGITVFSFDGITVSAPGATVVLRGLSISGQGGGPGIDVNSVARLTIDRCAISGMSGNGLLSTATGSDLTITDTIFHDNSGTGIGIAANSTVVLNRVRSEHNLFDGFYILPGSFATVTIIDSIFANNGVNGISIDVVSGANARVLVERSTMANNGGNGFVASAAGVSSAAYVTLSRNAVNGNFTNGMLLSGVAPGLIEGFMTGNSIQSNGQNGIRAQGNNLSSASANTLHGNQGAAIACDSAGAFLRTLGDNNGDTTSTVGGCLKNLPGI